MSVLAESQQILSDHFAGRTVRDLEVNFVMRNGVPMLADAVAYLIVQITEAHPVGDHALFIGEVEYIESRDCNPLLFHVGKYRRLHVEQPTTLPEQPAP